MHVCLRFWRQKGPFITDAAWDEDSAFHCWFYQLVQWLKTWVGCGFWMQRRNLLSIRGGMITVVVCSSAKQHLMWHSSLLNSKWMWGRKEDLQDIELLPKLVLQCKWKPHMWAEEKPCYKPFPKHILRKGIFYIFLDLEQCNWGLWPKVWRARAKLLWQSCCTKVCKYLLLILLPKDAFGWRRH